MSTEDNKRIVLRWKEEIWDKQNYSAVDEFFAPDYIGHITAWPGAAQDREALKQGFAAFFASFDMRDTREFLIAEGDWVAIHDTYWVKHARDFRGIPPTGRETTVTGVDIYHIVDGKIVEQWFEGDVTGALQRLGCLPSPEDGGP